MEDRSAVLWILLKLETAMEEGFMEIAFTEINIHSDVRGYSSVKARLDQGERKEYKNEEISLKMKTPHLQQALQQSSNNYPK